MVYIVDPYHIFHETRWNKNLWFGSQMLINLGQIEAYLKRSNDYDGILVGTSHTMNFKGSHLAKAVGAKGVLKLCNGNQSPEMGLMWLQKGLSTGKVKYCFVGMDALMYTIPKPDLVLESNKIYTDHPWTCLINIQCLQDVLNLMFIKLGLSQEKPELWSWKEPDCIHGWEDNIFELDHWIRPYKLKELKRKVPVLSHYQLKSCNQHEWVRYIDEIWLKAAKENPSVKFFLILTPCALTQSIAVLKEPNITPEEFYDGYFHFVRYLITACSKLQNIQVYGWYDCAFVGNCANFFDAIHYHSGISHYITWCIEHDKHRLTKENYDAYEARCVENLRAFKILDSYPHRDTFDELVAAEMQK